MKKLIYVAIGTSAGGLKALEKLIPLLPQTLNYVYIIAQHLDPHKESSLDTILQRITSLPVNEITFQTNFHPNNIYIIPAGFNLLYNQGNLVLEKVNQDIRQAIPSIDKLFEAIAIYKKQDAIGIVLTGAGHDGTAGVELIKKYTGKTIAQSPEEAPYNAMPQSAIKSNNIDYVLTLQEIAEALSNFFRTSLPYAYQKIQNLLLDQEKLDIDKYKHETILRRIEKRMLLVNITTLDKYVIYIQNNPEEIHLLYQNILIGVTKFFRDKDAFLALEDEIYLYLKDKPNDYEFRVWSIACSTGEEVYSLAILIAEVSKKLKKTFNVHIFATDIDENALFIARKGVYYKDLSKDVETDILQEYFTPVEGGYKIIDTIHEQIIFTKHNILKQPPFINQDIISCRNLLIYIQPAAQHELFALLNYSLKNDGLLFLGSSESPLINVQYFTPLNSLYKIYMKERLKQAVKISSHYFTNHMHNQKTPFHNTVKNDLNIESYLKESIFDFFAPNSIVIDSNYNIVYKKGTLSFLKIPDGFVNLNILNLLETSLQYEMRKILKKSFEENTLQSSKFLQYQPLSSQESIFVRLIAQPYSKMNVSTMLFLYFQELHTDDLQFNTQKLLTDESFIVKSLSSQLSDLQHENKLLSDTLIINKENLQLLNEELQSSNEELQSSNEELETSNEELQSSNEELQSSIRNEQELQKKLSAILNATQDGIIGLNMQGEHTFTNTAALSMLGFTQEELIGKNAHRLWHHTKSDGSHYPMKECTLHNYLTNVTSIRKEELFWTKSGTPFHVEVLQNPIIENEKTVGVILSFHDIGKEIELRKQAEYEHQLANLYINISGTLVMTLDLYGTITMINIEGAKLLGLSQEAVLGRNWFEYFIPQDDRDKAKKTFHTTITQEEEEIIKHYTNTIIDINNQKHLIAWTNSYTTDLEGKITGIISSGVDITKEEELSKKLLAQEHLYKLTFDEADIGIAHTTLDGKWIDVNEYLSHLLGYTKYELLSMHVNDITYPDDRDTDTYLMEQLLNHSKNIYHTEKRYIHKDGSTIWVSLSVIILKDEDGNTLYLLKLIRDISQLKLLMLQLQTEKERFEKIIDFTPLPIMLYSADGEILFLNKVFEKNCGYSKKELATIDKLILSLFPHEETQTLKKIKAYYENPLKKQKEQQTILTKDGSQRVGILNAVSLYNGDDKERQTYLIAIMDVTEMQQKDELMIAQSRQAAMGDMLAMIAHQWRQPLSIISMLANNIKLQQELGEEVSQKDISYLLEGLSKQTTYLSQTIDDFRNFFKPDKKKERLTLALIFQKVSTLVEKSLEHNNITLNIAQSDFVEITTYPNQLIQVIVNLINNAKDAIKTKQIEEGLINITVQQKKDKLTISICDNGGGIDPRIIDTIGEPYVTTKKENGTGLGLYMSIVIVRKNLGGKLTWKNTKDGCCFSITLTSS